MGSAISFCDCEGKREGHLLFFGRTANRRPWKLRTTYIERLQCNSLTVELRAVQGYIPFEVILCLAVSCGARRILCQKEGKGTRLSQEFVHLLDFVDFESISLKAKVRKYETHPKFESCFWFIQSLIGTFLPAISRFDLSLILWPSVIFDTSHPALEIPFWKITNSRKNSHQLFSLLLPWDLLCGTSILPWNNWTFLSISSASSKVRKRIPQANKYIKS